MSRAISILEHYFIFWVNNNSSSEKFFEEQKPKTCRKWTIFLCKRTWILFWVKKKFVPFEKQFYETKLHVINFSPQDLLKLLLDQKLQEQKRNKKKRRVKSTIDQNTSCKNCQNSVCINKTRSKFKDLYYKQYWRGVKDNKYFNCEIFWNKNDAFEYFTVWTFEPVFSWRCFS